MKDIRSILNSDARFIKSGKKLQNQSIRLSNLFDDEEIKESITSHIQSTENITRFLNVLQYSNNMGDSIVDIEFDKQDILNIIEGKLDSTLSKYNYEVPLELDIKESIKNLFLDYTELDITLEAPSNRDIIESFTKKEFKQKSENIKPSNKKQPKTNLLSNPSKYPVRKKVIDRSKLHYKSTSFTDVKLKSKDEDFWIQSVRLDFPLIPQPDCNNVIEKFNNNGNEYCIYGETNVPWLQCQISCTTDINKFKDSDILKLFPPIRLYTRSPYMYKEEYTECCSDIIYDRELGLIFPIDDYTEDQIRKNIIEYPHIDHLTYNAKVKGKDKHVEFWKFIELKGEITSTAKIWDYLGDTKYLPKTESFMNEYVVRKYIMDRDIKGIYHVHEMRGSLDPFITLYNTDIYYKNLGYDPLEVGKKCIESRKSFKLTRNPILNQKCS